MVPLISVLKILPCCWSQNVSHTALKQICTAIYPLQVKVSPALWAEPLKAKKKLDPAIVKARQDRKKKKIEKEIRKLSKLDKQLKPVIELEIPDALIKDMERRKRNSQISNAVQEERITLLKKWAKLRHQEVKYDFQVLDRLMYSQQKALDELRFESEELYQAAVKIDENLIPFKYKGPCETPAVENYPSPDGEYIDVSKKWE